MARSYEELVGSLGRAVYFRPARRRVRELLSRDAEPKLRVEGREFPLYDLSSTGFSLLAGPKERGWAPDERLEAMLLLHQREVFRGPVRVVRTEEFGSKLRVGLALSKGFLDLPELLRQDEESRLEQELKVGPLPLHRKIPSDYLAAVGRAVHFVQYYRQMLDRHEARYRAQGVAGQAAVDELAQRALEALRGPWTELERAASRAAVSCFEDPETLRAAKAYTETVLTPLVMDCPMVRRSYLKPLGYPGDYQVMLYYYRNALEGPSAFAQVFHKYFVEHPLSNGVRTRKDFMVEVLDREQRRYASQHPSGTFHALSLGCGPAREVAEFVARKQSWNGAIHWSLVDQEDEALSIAFNDGQRQLSTTHAQGSLECLHVSFSQLLNDPSLLPKKQPQNLIYSAGLFDYLREVKAQELIAGLYERLAPGGVLAVGNAKGPNDYFWSAEFVLDWTLLYRTREEMLRLAARLPEGAEVEVTLEPGNAYYFLMIRRP